MSHIPLAIGMRMGQDAFTPPSLKALLQELKPPSMPHKGARHKAVILETTYS